MNIYVGNLTPDTTDDELRQAFESFGEIASVKIIRDGATGESRGFGFIEMQSEDQAKAAIDAMNGLPGTKYPDRFGGAVASDDPEIIDRIRMLQNHGRREGGKYFQRLHAIDVLASRLQSRNSPIFWESARDIDYLYTFLKRKKEVDNVKDHR